MSRRFRQRISIALTLTVVAANLSLPVVAQSIEHKNIVCEDDFEKESLGKAPSNYLDNNKQEVTTSSAIVVDRGEEQAVWLNGEEKVVEINREFTTTIDDYVIISLDLRVDENKDRSQFIQIYDQSGNEALRFMIRNYGKELQYQAIDFNSDTKDPKGKVGDIKPGEWVTLEIIADMNTQTASTYYDGEYLGDLPFWNKLYNENYKVTGLQSIKTKTDSNAGHYIDNVVVSQTNELEIERPSEEDIVLVVNPSGENGAYTTVQAAVDAVKTNSEVKTTIQIAEGVYEEVVSIGVNKGNLEIVGAGVDKTTIVFDNYSGKAKEEGGEYSTFDSQTVEVVASNVTIKDLTIENSFEASKAHDQRAHQAVALKVKGNQIAVENCKILGRQDTLLTDGGTQYFYNCYIAGDVDFIFGKSQVVFEECEIFSLDRGDSKNNGYIVAPSTSSSDAYGYLFLRCKLTAPDTIAKDSVYLGRPWCPNGLDSNKPAAFFKACEMGEHIKTDAWSDMGNAPATHGRFYEYGTTVNGELIKATESRKQLVPEIAERFTIANVLNGWEIGKTVEEAKEPLNVGETELPGSQVNTEIPDGTVIFEDDFNQCTIDERPEGYEISKTTEDKVVKGNAVYAVEKVEAGDLAIYVGQEEDMQEGESKGQVQLIKKFDVQKGLFTVSVDFSIEKVASDTYLALVDTKGKEAVRIEMRGKNLAYRYKNEEGKIVDVAVSSELKADEWVNVKVVTDLEAQKADVYVDGVPTRNLPFYNYGYGVKSVDSFKTVTPRTKVIGHRVDNLSIITGDTTRNNSASFLPENFAPSEMDYILTNNQHIALHQEGIIAINEDSVVNKPSAVDEVSISRVDVIDEEIVLVTLNGQFDAFNFKDIVLKKVGTSAEDLSIKASAAGQTLNRLGETVLVYKLDQKLEGILLDGTEVEAEVVSNLSKDLNGKSLKVGDCKRLEQVIESNVTELTLTVAQDGQGDFIKVQDAINMVVDQGKIPTTIYIKAGTYEEVVTIPNSKSHITFIGDGRDKTKITAGNYSGKDKGDGTTYGTSDSASVFIKGNDLTFRGITFENSFNKSIAHDGKTHQAVAVNVDGERVSFERCGFLGKQDTLLTNGGTQYFYKCYVEGDVDFIFSRSQAVFEECTLHSVGSGYITAPSTAADKEYGYLFLRCKLTADESVASNSVSLGRPWRPDACVLYRETEMGAHIRTEGWSNMSDNKAEEARFYEYKNTGVGAVINESRRQLTDAEADKWTIANVLGGWEPTHTDEDDETTEPEVPEVPEQPEEKPETPEVPEQPEEPSDEESDDDYVPSTSLATQSFLQKVAILTLSQKEEIQGQFSTYLPYTSLSTTLSLEELKYLTNNLFTEKQLQEVIEKPSLLAELGVELDWEVVTLSTGKKVEFKDVSEKHWARDTIQMLVEKGMIQGFEDGTFKPNQTLKVMDAFTLLDRVLLLNGITEMSLPRSIVEKYVTQKESWAFSHMASVSSKLRETTLKAVTQTQEVPLIRELLAQVLYDVTNGELKNTQGTKVFTDVGASSYKEAIDYCVQTGLLKGVSDTEMSPEKAVTRAEMAVIIERLNELLSE